jgi:hypothetical protein
MMIPSWTGRPGGRQTRTTGRNLRLEDGTGGLREALAGPTPPISLTGQRTAFGALILPLP